jgi:hypothetical protein
MKNIILILSLLIINSCSKGGGTSSTTTPPPDLVFELGLDCSAPRATSINQGLPFHAKQRFLDEDYFLICSAQDLFELGSNPTHYNKNFILGNDIDLFSLYDMSELDYLNGPITNQFMIGRYPNKPYTGVFLGNGYSISDFRFINNPSTPDEYCGLFGYVQNAQISQIYLDSPRVDSYTDAAKCAPLIGLAENSLIFENLVRYSPIEGIDEEYWSFIRGNKISGLVARLDASTVSDSYSIIRLETAKTADMPLAGGLYIDSVNSSSIVNSFYDGSSLNSFHLDTIKGGIGVFSPTNDAENVQPVSELIRNTYYSLSSGFSQACSDDSLCSQSGLTTPIDKTISGEDYFKNKLNEPLLQWNEQYWFFYNDQYPETL